MEDASRRRAWLGRLTAIVGLLVATLAGGALLLSRADGPVFVFAGGPLRTGEQVEFAPAPPRAPVGALHNARHGPP